MYGAEFVQSVDISKYGYKSYQWEQTINTTPLSTVNGVTLKNPITDGTLDNKGNNVNDPYYYTPTDKFMYGNFALFQDAPGTSKTNYSFSAVTTLVGINGTTVTPMRTFSWGFNVTNGVTTLSPLVVH